MGIKPQDVLVALKLIANPEASWSYPKLASEIRLSVSETFASTHRLTAMHLLQGGLGAPQLDRRAIFRFLIHGIRYAFPAARGGLTRGVATSYGAPPLNRLLVGKTELPPVWPLPRGKVRGYEFQPLYKSVPVAASRDEKLYELLALVDALRDGRARERSLAAYELAVRLGVPEE
jgi:hypothetical protein